MFAEKRLTNHRSKGEGVGEHLTNQKIMRVWKKPGAIDDTELVGVT